MADVSPVALFFFGLALVAASTLGAWAYLRFGLAVERPLPQLRRWTGPTYIVVGLFELSAGFLTFVRGDGRFWLPVVFGLALTIGGGYYFGRRTIS